MSKNQYLTAAHEHGIATITMNRPEVYNAFNDGLTYELQGALKAAKKDKEVRVIVITGSGKAFSSGQDLKDHAAHEGRPFSESLHKRYNPIIKSLRKIPKPVICRLNGVAAGAGCSLALACDIILAAEEAILIEVFVNIGLVLDSGSSYFLPRVLGYNRAFEISTMGTKVTANQALDWGMVNAVVPLEELDQLVKKYTDYYVQAPTKAIGMMKRMLNKSYGSSLKEVLQFEAYYQDKAGATKDHKEGVTAFSEKRSPQFKGS
ncbi:MAG: enoyl-CoA hydratase-related protein [Cyclobacteriaceae bacterium]|nr:enoyl-CoA hydratase-related protein [Cyclobacteriaceae bacterium]